MSDAKGCHAAGDDVMLRILAIGAGAAIGLALPRPAPAFDPGDVFWGSGTCGSPCGLFEVTGGGSIGAGQLVAATTRVPGQMAWSADFQTLYVGEWDLDRIAALPNAGSPSVFATGVRGPTGLLRAGDGRLLAASYDDRAVYDVSAGGDFGAATAFATGLGRPRNLVQLRSGAILVADQNGGRVLDIRAGGDFALAQGLAYGFSSGPFDLAEDPEGRVFASSFDGVYDVSAGGDFSAAAPFAHGQEFIGLTVDAQGRLLAVAFDSDRVYDVSAGGDFSAAAPFAQGMPGFGDTLLDTLPGGPGTPVAIPALGAWGLALLAAGLLAAARRRMLAAPGEAPGVASLRPHGAEDFPNALQAGRGPGL